MKKLFICTSILIILIGVADFLFWQKAYREINALNGPPSPLEFIKHPSALRSALWLLRIDIFSKDDSLDVVSLAYDITIGLNRQRILAAGITLAGLCCLLMCFRAKSRKPRILLKSGKYITGVFSVLLIAAVFISLVTHKRKTPEWDRQRYIPDNILEYQRRFQEVNPDIIPPYCDEGIALTNEIVFDTHIEMDKRGWITIHNAKLSRTVLKNMLKKKRERCLRHPEQLRVFLWVDYRCSHDDWKEMLEMVETVFKPESIYFVVQKNLESGREYTALHHSKWTEDIATNAPPRSMDIEPLEELEEIEEI
ncbi:hypothetical protein ACFLS1_01395 [Verrucomicrobiota bacterium]